MSEGFNHMYAGIIVSSQQLPSKTKNPLTKMTSGVFIDTCVWLCMNNTLPPLCHPHKLFATQLKGLIGGSLNVHPKH